MSSPTRKPLVIYHSPCADGFTAAYIAWREFGRNADYLAQGYADDPVMPDVADRFVYILDFSYRADFMRKMAELAATVIVLDHHQSAEADLLPLLEEGVIQGEFDMERSGAGIAWDFWNDHEARPMFVNMVEDRDLWKYEIPGSKEFNMALF